MFWSSIKQCEVDSHIVCQKTQTDGSKGNSKANSVLKASFQESTRGKFVDYIKQWMVYAKDIDDIEIHHVLDFFKCKMCSGLYSSYSKLFNYK